MSVTDPVNDHDPDPTITDADRVKLMVDALKHYQDGFTKSSYSSMGFQLLVAGWLMTSHDAQGFLGAHPTLGSVGIAIIILCAAGYVMMSVRIQRLSQGIGDRLATIPGAGGTYEHFVITRQGVMVFTAIMGAVGVLVVFLIATIAFN